MQTILNNKLSSMTIIGSRYLVLQLRVGKDTYTYLFLEPLFLSFTRVFFSKKNEINRVVYHHFTWLESSFCLFLLPSCLFSRPPWLLFCACRAQARSEFAS